MRKRILLLVPALLLFAGAAIVSSCKKDDPEASTVTDIDGNVYGIITIGNQQWMDRNLEVRHYRNGDALLNGIAAANGQKAGAWMFYDNNAEIGAVYGNLYNSYAVNDSRGIAPAGWHVATLADWREMIEYAGGSSVAGGKLKETGTTHWLDPNTDATDLYGFKALPGGYGAATGYYLGHYSSFWTSTIVDGYTEATYNFYLYYNNPTTQEDWDSGGGGYSVRCVKDK